MTEFEFEGEPVPDCPECGRELNSWKHFVNHVQWMMRNADSIEEREAHAWNELPYERREVFEKADLPFTVTPQVPKRDSVDPEWILRDHESVEKRDDGISHEAYDST